jgi:hypothetical protein
MSGVVGNWNTSQNCMWMWNWQLIVWRLPAGWKSELCTEASRSILTYVSPESGERWVVRAVLYHGFPSVSIIGNFFSPTCMGVKWGWYYIGVWLYVFLFFICLFTQLPVRPRVKRVTLRDLLFLLEQEKETCRTSLLYKAFLKWWWLCLVFLAFLCQKVRSGGIKELSSLPSYTLIEWILFLCKWLSGYVIYSEVNMYYVLWMCWESGDTTHCSQENQVIFAHYEWRIFLSGNHILHK